MSAAADGTVSPPTCCDTGRWVSRPWTMTAAPVVSDSAALTASARQHTTEYSDVGPSTHSPRLRPGRLGVQATWNVASGMPV